MSFKPRTAKVTLYQGDYQQRIAEAREAAGAAKERAEAARKAEGAAGSVRTLSETPASADLAAEYQRLAQDHDDLVAEAEADGAVVVTLQALGRTKWAEGVEQFPPRTDESVPEEIRKSDAELGVNDKDFGEWLVPLSIAEISEPGLSADDLLEAISSAQFGTLYGVAFALNRSLGSDPKALPRLLPSLSSAAIGN